MRCLQKFTPRNQNAVVGIHIKNETRVEEEFRVREVTVTDRQLLSRSDTPESSHLEGGGSFEDLRVRAVGVVESVGKRHECSAISRGMRARLHCGRSPLKRSSRALSLVPPHAFRVQLFDQSLHEHHSVQIAKRCSRLSEQFHTSPTIQVTLARCHVHLVRCCVRGGALCHSPRHRLQKGHRKAAGKAPYVGRELGDIPAHVLMVKQQRHGNIAPFHGSTEQSHET
mmetsp:Transcript_5709/g.16265  ORF Transcript_5709/g.16265 Transcript_5709/m.16265 type:complete len:226 (-) Transcript_5709:350-1027(-)